MYWFVFCKGDILLEKQGDHEYTIPQGNECPVVLHPWNTVHNITPMADGTIVKTVRIDHPVTDSTPLSAEATERKAVFEVFGLRDSFHVLPEAQYLKAGKCQEILYWDSQTKFCGICGSPMKLETDISKRCTGCGKELWPLLATAVIVLIRREDHVLLVRAKNFRSNHYGLVAGFVETGETLEEAVHREVLEETGLRIQNLHYFGSQPWPYPCGLMVGFTADYLSGDIALQKEELTTAGWFTRSTMPAIPGKMSIARMLIDDWLAEK